MVTFEISTLEFVKCEFFKGPFKGYSEFDIGSTFSKVPGSTFCEGPGPLYKVCHSYEITSLM